MTDMKNSLNWIPPQHYPTNCAYPQHQKKQARAFISPEPDNNENPFYCLIYMI